VSIGLKNKLFLRLEVGLLHFKAFNIDYFALFPQDTNNRFVYLYGKITTIILVSKVIIVFVLFF